jgi:hypothetical protein
MALASSAIYTTCVAGYKIVKQDRIRIISTKTISKKLYDYVTTLDKKRVENYLYNHRIEKKSSDINATINKLDNIIIFETVSLTHAKAIELSKD